MCIRDRLRVHHQNNWKFPQYVTIHAEGPPHKRKYIMGLERHDAKPDEPIETRCISFGIGSSKKEGEQNASKMALAIYGELKQDQYLLSDIYYPPWDKIANFDGETMIIKLADTDENKQNKQEQMPMPIEKSESDSESSDIFNEPVIKPVQIKEKTSKVKIIEPELSDSEEEISKKIKKQEKIIKLVKPNSKTNKKIKKQEINYDSDESVHSDKSI
jgi:hypothetical protein